MAVKQKTTIRKFEERDFDDLHRLLSDSEVMQYLEPPFSKEKTKSFLFDSCLAESPLVYAVEVDEEFAGYVIYHEYDEKSVEIGWVLMPEYWGSGVASELTRIMITRAAEDNKYVVIECAPDQKATIRIAEKFGFVFEGFEEGLNHYRLKRN